MTRIDTDTAHEVTRTTIRMCAAIRRDCGWTQSADAHSRHAALIADTRRNIIPRCDVVTAAMVDSMLRAEESAMAAKMVA